MTDIEQRAHDFAIAAVKSFQITSNEKRLKQNNNPQFNVNELIDTYLNAYNLMKDKLNKKAIS